MMHGISRRAAMCRTRPPSHCHAIPPRHGNGSSSRRQHGVGTRAAQWLESAPCSRDNGSREGQLQALNIAESGLEELYSATAGAREKKAVARVCEWFAAKRRHAEEHAKMSEVRGDAEGLTEFEKLIRQLLMEGDVHSMYKVFASLEHIDRTVIPVTASQDEPVLEQLAQVLDQRARLVSLFEAVSRTHGGVVNLAELKGGLAAMGIYGLDDVSVQAIGGALGLADASDLGPAQLGLDEFVAVLEECECKGWGGATHWGGRGVQASYDEGGSEGIDGSEDVRFLRGVAYHDQRLA